jgi:hypothetical protein
MARWLKGVTPDGAKPFKKGFDERRAGGRPKGIENSKTRLLRLLALTTKQKNPVTGETEEFTVLERMDMALVNKALKGDRGAYKELLDRLEGQPKQEIETTQTGPISIKLIEK